MPAGHRHPREQQQRRVGDPPAARRSLDEPVSFEDLLDRARSERRPREQVSSQIEIEVIDRRLGANPLLVSDPAIRLFPPVDHLLGLADHLVAHPVRKAVAFHHHGLCRHGHVERQDPVPFEDEPVDATGNWGAQTPRRHGEEVLDGLVGVVVTRGGTVVLDAQEKQPAVGVGEGRDVLGDRVSDRAPGQQPWRGGLAIPDRLELEELPFLSREQVSQLGIGEERRVHAEAQASARSRAACLVAFVWPVVEELRMFCEEAIAQLLLEGRRRGGLLSEHVLFDDRLLVGLAVPFGRDRAKKISQLCEARLSRSYASPSEPGSTTPDWTRWRATSPAPGASPSPCWCGSPWHRSENPHPKAPPGR